jgi:CheY-like chemotaxis protein
LLSGRRKLLLADDSPTVQKVISLFLEEEGMEVVAVGDGQEALRLLEEQPPPDILIADACMPGPDGYELCERVRADARLRHIPVILLVGKFEPFNEAEARRVGADTVLTKPFQSIRDLVSRVGSLLGGRPKQEESDAARTPREETAEASAARAEHPSAHADAQAGGHGEAFGSELARPFADLAADDELIEAKPAESFFEPARAEAGGRAAASEEFEVLEHTEEFETSAHAPDVFAASHDAAREVSGANGHAAAHEAQAAQPARGARHAGEARQPEEAQAAHETWPSDEARPAYSPDEARPAHSFAASASEAGEGLLAARGSFNARAAGAAAADDALLDLGQFEPPSRGPATEADDFILDLEEDLPAPHAAQNLFAQPDAPSAFAEASHGAPEVFDEEPEVVMQDEPQLFAPPSFGHEVGSEPRGFVEPSVVPAEEPVPATVEGEYTDGSVEGDVPKPPAAFYAAPHAEEATAAHAEEASGAAAHEPGDARETAEPSTEVYTVGSARAGVEDAPRAGSLSQAEVDAIARRVVELISDKVVREIAWEVVPELAELLVKRKLEEEGKSAG